MSTATTTAKVSVESIPLSKITLPPDNPRQNFDEAEIASLAGSIESVGLLEPIIVRKKGRKFELVAGERRMRACQFLERTEIAASVRKLNDCEAAEIRLLENLDRKNLNPIEEATAFRQLQELGHSPESIAALTRMTESTIGGRLGLLVLPADWQERVKSEELSPAQAEYLVSWVKYPAVLAAMEKSVGTPMPLTQWRYELVQIVMSLSRSMMDDATGPRFEADEETEVRLEIVDLELSPGRVIRRAMNVSLWDELQDKVDIEAREELKPSPMAIDPAPSTPQRTGFRNTPASERPEVSQPENRSEADLSEVIREWKAEWLRELVGEKLAECDCGALEEFCEFAQIDPTSEWKLQRGLLELLTTRELGELGEELEVDLSQCRDDGERVAVFLHEAPQQVPRIVAEA